MRVGLKILLIGSGAELMNNPIRGGFLADAAKWFDGLPHQVTAWDWLQDQLSEATLKDFAQRFSPAQPPAPEAPAKQASAEASSRIKEPVYQIRFVMPTRQSNSLLIGKMEFLLDGAVYNTIIATSSIPGRQYSGAWNRKGGLIPPTSMVRAKTGRGWRVKTAPIYMPNVAGVSGNFYPIEPFGLNTDGANRGDFGIHFDANVPGSMGCVVAITDKGWTATQRELKLISGLGIRAIDLIVEYTG
jgi:hypothetical protein